MDQTTLIILVGGIIFLSSMVLAIYFLFFTGKKEGDSCSKSEATDKNGTSYEYDEDLECVPTVCKEGYELSGNVCVEETSTPSSTPSSTPDYQGTCLINEVQLGDGTCVDFWTKDAYAITGDLSGVVNFNSLPGYSLLSNAAGTSNLVSCSGTTLTSPTDKIVSLGECKDKCDESINCGGFTFTYSGAQTYNCLLYDFDDFSNVDASTNELDHCYMRTAPTIASSKISNVIISGTDTQISNIYMMPLEISNTYISSNILTSNNEQVIGMFIDRPTAASGNQLKIIYTGTVAASGLNVWDTINNSEDSYCKDDSDLGMDRYTIQTFYYKNMVCDNTSNEIDSAYFIAEEINKDIFKIKTSNAPDTFHWDGHETRLPTTYLKVDSDGILKYAIDKADGSYFTFKKLTDTEAGGLVVGGISALHDSTSTDFVDVKIVGSSAQVPTAALQTSQLPTNAPSEVYEVRVIKTIDGVSV